MRTLKYGSIGPSVQLLQLGLNRAGYAPLETDGIFGTATMQTVTRFQQANGRDPGLIDFWCSIGRRFHSLILKYATPVFPEKTGFDDYYYFTLTR